MEPNVIDFSMVFLVAIGGSLGLLVGEILRSNSSWTRTLDVITGVWAMTLTLYLVDRVIIPLLSH